MNFKESSDASKSTTTNLGNPVPPLEPNRREFLVGLGGAALLTALSAESAYTQTPQSPLNIARVAIPTSRMPRSEDKLSALRSEAGLEVFPLSHTMLERSIALTLDKLDLKPFDNSILAAVLVRAGELLRQGDSDLAFCELDNDLQPWGRDGRDKPQLRRLYDSARVWVYRDFTITTPEPPEGW